MSNEKKRKIAIIVIIVALVVLLAAVGYLVFKAIITQMEADEYNRLASSYAANLATSRPTEDPNNTQDATGEIIKPENPIDLESLSKQNSDVYAWLYVPDTNVNYPIAQSQEADDYYLHRNIYKEYSFAGMIYSEKVNKKDWSDRVTLLYGHNMLDGSMFKTLHKYEDTEFFDSHKYFYIYTKDRKLTYEVVSAFVYDDRHIMNSFDFTDDDVFQSWLETAKNPHSTVSNVNSDVQLSLDSKMVVLSTCNGNYIGRYLVEGVLVKDEETR